MMYAGPQDDGISKAPDRHYCHAFYGKRFDETQGAPPNCTDVDRETGVCGMCGTDTSRPSVTDRDALLTMLREHGYVSTSLNLDGIDGWGIRCSCGHQEPWAFENVHADIWHDEHRVDAFLAARPAPDTLADRVQALADEWGSTRTQDWTIYRGDAARALRALVAGPNSTDKEN